MICSFEHNFLFVKTRKTASTSVELALTRMCGEQDIVTPISPDDEIARFRQGLHPRNYMDSPLRERLLDYVVTARVPRLVKLSRRHIGPLRFFNHMRAERIRSNLDDRWEQLVRFTVERHPYEKVLSKAHYWKGVRKDCWDADLSEIIDKVIDSDCYLNYPLYTIDGSLAVHEVLRYENLETELNAFLSRVGAPPAAPLAQLKGGFRTNRKPAEEILSSAQRARVRDAAAYEFELMDYAA